MNESRILQEFSDAYPYFDKASIEKIIPIGQMTEFKKGSSFIPYGKTDKRIGFVTDGLFRGVVFENDEEQTLWFSSELDILASYISILKGAPSNLTYEALEDSRVFVIDYEEFRKLAETDQHLSMSLLRMMEKLLLESYERLEKFIFYSPEDRYQRILKDKPEILNRVSQKLLASYIGITPVSLSRLRARIKR